MKRVMIIGQPGAGKSTFAQQLGAATGLPVVHIDKIHWQSGWIERSGPEKDLLIAKVHASDRWIFEGRRSVTWPERLHRADTLIWLDFPFGIRSWRVFKRTTKYYGRSRPDLPSGCPERFSPDFIKWIWNTRHSGRRLMQKTFANAPKSKTCLQFSTSKQIARFLETL